MIARGTGTLTSRTLVRTRKPRRTTAHVWATANCIAVTSAERSRADTTPNLGFKFLKTIGTLTAIVTATITTTTIAARIAAAATGIVTAATEVLSIFAKPR